MDLFQVMAQGSALGQQLFSLFVCDLFLFVDEADKMSYADDNTPLCVLKILTSRWKHQRK